MALSRVLSPTLVGRDSELSTLEDALLSALRGDGGVVIVGGEAGIGKTRLVGALSERARRLGCVVLSGACSEAELSLPYLPFLEAIGNYLVTADIVPMRDRLGSAAEELAQLFPQLGRPGTFSGENEQAKMRLFESILILLRDAASRRALLLILEDLHWADPSTRELLDYATRRLRSTNVLLVATYRTDEMHRKHALQPTIQAWRRNRQVELVDLNALNADQVAEMVCAIFEEQSVSAEFRDFLRDRSEGNPFVLEEMLRDALDRGDIFHTDTGWDRKTLAEIRIPATVRDTILQRLERLSRDDVAVLSAASVMGRSFDLQTLAEVARVDENVALSALETSATAQLIEPEDPRSGRYRFRHALTREAIYEDLVVPRRQQLHSRVADAMKSHKEGAPVDLANHLFIAGRNEEAVAMCLAAAREAEDALAFHDAAELLERASPHVTDAIERSRLMCRAGEDYWNNTEPAAARRLLEAGVAGLESAGLAVEAATPRLMLGRCYWELLRSDLAREQFEHARKVLEPEGPSEALSIAYIRLSGLILFNRGTETSLGYAQRAAEIAQEANAPLALAWSWNFLAMSEIALGRLQSGFDHLESSYRTALAGGFHFQAVNAIFNAGYAAVHLGLGDRVRLWKERAENAEWAGSVWTPYFRSLMTLYQGHILEALDLARLALIRARDSGHEKQHWRSQLMIVHALAENLQASEAEPLLPLLSTRIEGQDTVYDTTPRIRTKLALGDPAGALEMARTVSPDVADIVSPADVVAEAARGDPEWLKEFIANIGVQGENLASPRLAAANGRLALYEGRFEDALRELRSAVDAFEDGGLRLDVWHVGRSLAEAEARAGDRDAARRRLLKIVAEAQPAGALLAARLARELASDLGIQLGAETPAAERPVPRVATGERMVSVLFADVREYTELSGQSAPADLADRIATLQRWALQEVERRHGIVDKFAGDAVMATFNVAGQSLDHAVQALRAAMTIIDKAALAGLPVGAGVAVGPAVVGNLAESANVSVLGEVTNLAARLQAEAGAGQVLMSDEAFKRARVWLDGQRIPVDRLELALKGFSSPVVVYRVATGVAATAPA